MAITKVPVELSSTTGIVDNSNATAITIDSSENVTFAGKITLGDGHQIGNDSTDNLVLNSSSAENIVVASAASLFFNTGASSLTSQGTTRVLMSSNGNVGIGNTSPDAMLRIDQDANSLALKVTGGGGGVNIAEFTRDVGADASVQIGASAGTPRIAFVDANTFAIGVNNNTFEIADNGQLGTNTRFIINNTGNIGIGALAPTATLSAKTVINVDSSGTQAILLLNNEHGYGVGVGTAGTAIQFARDDAATNGQTIIGAQIHSGNENETTSNPHNLIFSTKTGVSPYNLTEAMRINSLQHVGIGVTNPLAQLSVTNSTLTNVSTTGTPSIRAEGSYGGGIALLDTKEAGWYAQDNGGSLYQYVGRTVGSDTPASKVVMSYKEDGKIGIGTTTPTHPFHILTLASNDTIDETKGLVKFQSSGGNGMIFGTIASSPYTSYIQSAYVIDTSTARYALTLNPIGGNVGIGTTSPSTTLDVQGAIQASESGGDFIRMQTDGNNNIFDINSGAYVFRTSGFSEKMRITSSGNVGIGNASPTTTLDVVGSGKFQPAIGSGDALVTIAQTNSNAYVHAGVKINAGNTNPFYIYQSGSSNTLRFNYNSLSDAGGQMVITDGGKVGIGTSSPATSLHIANAGNSFLTLERTGTTGGTGKFGINMEGGSSQQTTMGYDDGGKLVIGRSSDPATMAGFNNDFILDSSGNVGIGDTSPGHKLDVAGSINLSAGSLNLRDDEALGHDGTSLYIKAPGLIYLYPGNANKGNISTAGKLTVTNFTSNNFRDVGSGQTYATNRDMFISGGAGMASYSSYSGGSGQPTTYDWTAQFGNGSRGFEITASWLSTNGAGPYYVRTLRDCCQNWSTWHTLDVTAVSDSRTKTEVKNITSPRTIIDGLQGITYMSLNPDGTTGDINEDNPDPQNRQENMIPREREYGYIAQDAIKIVPSVVDYHKNLDTPNEHGWANAYMLRYERLIPVLTEALKECYAKIDTLEAEVKTLKGE